MHPLHKRLLLLMALGLLAVPVTAAGVAYACTALATTSVSRSAATVGETVTVSGKGFAPHGASDIRTSPAEVHLDTPNGPLLAKASPSSSETGGTFSVDITVPDGVSPGEHVLVVTQNGISGTPAYGTPARTVLTVLPKPKPAPPAAAAQTVAEAAPALPAATVVAPIVAQVVSTPAAPRRGSTALAKAKAKALARTKARGRALAACRSKYSTKRAKTSAARKRIASQRARCVRAAIRRTA